MELLNSRELATALWGIVLAAWAVRRPETRKPLFQVLKLFCGPKILVPILLMLLYAASEVRILALAGLWTTAHLKDTIVWFCAGAISLVFRFVGAKQDENIFRVIALDSFRLIILIEFLVNTYTFPLLAELILIPVLFWIGALGAVAEMDKKNHLAAKFIKGVQAIGGALILIIVLGRAAHDAHTPQTLDTLRSIALAPLLSLLLTPFVYLLVLCAEYEQIFWRIDFGNGKEARFSRYAKARIAVHVRLNLRAARRLLRRHAVDLIEMRTKGDVEAVLRAKCVHERTVLEPHIA